MIFGRVIYQGIKLFDFLPSKNATFQYKSFKKNALGLDEMFKPVSKQYLPRYFSEIPVLD